MIESEVGSLTGEQIVNLSHTQFRTPRKKSKKNPVNRMLLFSIAQTEQRVRERLVY